MNMLYNNALDLHYVSLELNTAKEGLGGRRRASDYAKGRKRLKSFLGDNITIYGNTDESDVSVDIEYLKSLLGENLASKVLKAAKLKKGNHWVLNTEVYTLLMHSKYYLLRKHYKNSDCIAWIDVGLTNKRKWFTKYHHYLNRVNKLENTHHFFGAGWHVKWDDTSIGRSGYCKHPGAARVPAGGLIYFTSSLYEKFFQDYIEMLEILLDAGYSPTDEDVMGVMKHRFKKSYMSVHWKMPGLMNAVHQPKALGVCSADILLLHPSDYTFPDTPLPDGVALHTLLIPKDEQYDKLLREWWKKNRAECKATHLWVISALCGIPNKLPNISAVTGMAAPEVHSDSSLVKNWRGNKDRKHLPDGVHPVGTNTSLVCFHTDALDLIAEKRFDTLYANGCYAGLRTPSLLHALGMDVTKLKMPKSQWVERVPEDITLLADRWGDNYHEAIEMLRIIDKIFTDEDVMYFLWAGSLIGAERHNDFIPWDDDIDIIIVEQSNLPRLEQRLNDAGLSILKRKHETKVFYTDKKKIPKYRYSWPFVDVFYCSRWKQEIKMFEKGHDDEGVTIYTRLKRQYKMSDVFPLKRVPVGPLMLPVPQNPHAILNSYYKDFATTVHSPGYCHSKERGIRLRSSHQWHRVKALMPKVYARGVFDLMHPGHLSFLSKSRLCGSYLHVGVQSDASVFAQKNKYPKLSESQRLEAVRLLPFVHSAFLYSDLDPTEDIKRVEATHFSHGPEYGNCEEHKRGLKYCKDNGIEIREVPRMPDISTTKLTMSNKQNVAKEYWNNLTEYPTYGDKRNSRVALDVKWILKHLTLDETSFCDLGGGDGLMLFELLKALHGKREKVIAELVERSDSLYKHASALLAERATIHHADICDKSYIFPKTDVAFLMGVIPYIFTDETVNCVLSRIKSNKLILRSPCSMSDRIEINKFSKQLNSQYSAVYRTKGEIEVLICKHFNLVAVDRIYPDSKESDFGTKHFIFEAIRK